MSLTTSMRTGVDGAEELAKTNPITASLYVQFGCGLTAPSQWLNFDASPSLRVQKLPMIGSLLTKGRAQFPKNTRYGDVVRGLPLPSGSCLGVYTSHTLEHLARSDFDKAIAEAYRLLKSGGIFRLVVPDLALITARYLDRVRRSETDANDKFMQEACLGLNSRSRSPVGMLSAVFGNSAHLWMWDEPSLKSALETLGFVRVRRAQFNDCEDPHFKYVEAEDRFVDAVGMQGIRP